MKFVRKTHEVEALQHDGTNDCAIKLEAWILSLGGDATAYLIGAVDFTQKNAFVRVNSQRAMNLVGPGAWVVHVSEGKFYAVSNEDFHILYEPAEPVVDEPTA
jgi:hypothetical protein